MITDEKRREVAQELRKQAAYCDGSLSEWWQRLQDTVTGEVDFADPKETFNAIADLIDRPLVHIGVNKHGRGFCANCGCDDWCIADGSHFCPDCGVELLDD